MPMHPSWKGHLKISLASIPVQAFTASAGTESSEIALNQLHRPCKSRINYKKTCPIHGEVPNSEIVSGFEYAKGQYVVVERHELSSIAADLEKSLTIECFVPPGSIGPEYAAGQSYYLIPDGRVGQKPYTLICEAVNHARLHGVGEMVISRKQRLVRLRTSGKLIVIDILHYEGEMRSANKFLPDVPEVAVTTAELKLAQSLVEQMKLPEFDAKQYADDYMSRMKTLIESKLKGKKVAVPHMDESPTVINFMDALRKSVKAIPIPSRKSKRTKSTTLKSTARRTAPAKKTHRKTG